MKKLVDMSMGLNDQALAVGLMLSRYDADVLLGAGREGKTVPFSLETKAWYGGRERGMCLIVTPWKKGPKLAVCWYEHRNSDQIDVLSFEFTTTDLADFLNGPYVGDVPAGAWDGVKGFDAWHIKDAGDEVLRRVMDFCRRNS